VIVAIAAEDRRAFENATIVGEAICSELGCNVEWTGFPTGSPYLVLSQLELHLPTSWPRRRWHGHFDGEDLRIRKAVGLFVELMQPTPAVVVIALDIDRQTDRRTGLLRGVERANNESTSKAVVAAMNPEAEAWRIAAFQPTSPEAMKRHTDIKAALTFDPVQEPDRLNSTVTTAGLRDAKNCHDHLYPIEEESHASLRRPIHELESTETSTGLPAYIGDFRSALITADPSLVPR
jgi:hypothetical protein